MPNSVAWIPVPCALKRWGPVVAVAALSACASAPPPSPVAVVELRATDVAQPVAGKPVSGVIRLTQRGQEVVLRGEVQNLRPGGSNGIYIYEDGDCSAAAATDARKHFNPTNAGHSFAGSGHAGDLPQRAQATPPARRKCITSAKPSLLPPVRST